MSINAIYASKLYKASHRKDKIRAAASNPLNKELVLQLDEYLDDVPEADVNPKEVSSKDRDNSPDEKIRPSVHSGHGGGGTPPMGGSGGMDHHLSDQLKDEEGPDFDTPDQEPSESEPNDVGESTKVSRTKVMATINIADNIDSLVGMLNSREDTAGVCRCIIKDNELWIHYNDSINLNNVMEPVIAVLNAANYFKLDFNRLARTENAIVFSISVTAVPVKPLEETK